VTNLQLKDVPAVRADQIRARAKQRHLSISQYLLNLAIEDLQLVPVDEWLDGLASRSYGSLHPDTDVDALIREDRATR
jgi:hypothetical protein